MESKIVSDVRPLPQSLSETTEYIKREMYEVASHFVYIGYLLWCVKFKEHYRSGGYSDVYEYAADQLGFKRTTTKNLIGISEAFGNYYYHSFSCSILPTPELKPAYQDFNYSQLTEMLSMSEKQRAQVTPDMSVRQIRELKKAIVPASEPEFPLEPEYETTPMELPEPDSVSEPVGQTSDQNMICLSLSKDDACFICRLIREEVEYYLEPGISDYDRATALIAELNRLGVF